MMKFGRSWMAVALMATLGGCAHDEQPRPRPLTPAIIGDANADPEKAFPANPVSNVDQPGEISPDESNRPRRAAQPAATPPPENALPDIIRKTVREPGLSLEDSSSAATQTAGATTSPMSATTSAATTSTATVPGISQGEYVTLGGVVAEVNGTPIYANKVLADIQPILIADAKQMGENEFRSAAQDEIRKAVEAMIRGELVYAAAERNLDQKDKQIAEAMTMRWRQEQINAAGSIELARRRALAVTGKTFESLVQDQYRGNMSGLYYQRKIAPRIQITAQDERNYYDEFRDSAFTDPATVRFRLIKIDVEKAGGRAQAMKKITELRNRIVNAGESFEGIARSVNDDERLRESGGDLGTAIQKGAFAIEPVEKAVWKTPVGEVTPVIDAGNALYLAKVENKKDAHVWPFEEQDVQDRIYHALWARQLTALEAQEQQKLLKDAIVRSSDKMAQTALDMAMQNYPRWSKR